jgi:hypothetical protein
MRAATKREAALARLRIKPHDGQGVGRRHIPAWGKIRYRPLRRNAKDELDFAYVGFHWRYLAFVIKENELWLVIKALVVNQTQPSGGDL